VEDAIFIEVDVTFSGKKAFPYLLNMVTSNLHTNEHQVAAQIIMTKVKMAAKNPPSRRRYV
jgi:hypothetical protein